MKIVSLDIETTGLDPTQDDILEVGAVYADLTEESDDRPPFRCVIVSESGRYNVTPFCASMHQSLWVEIETAEKAFNQFAREDNTDEKYGHFHLHRSDGTVLWNSKLETWYCRPEMIGWCFFQWLSQFGITPGERINVAGKNAAMFDLPFLNEPPYLFSEAARVIVRHRIVDPAILFFRLGEDTAPPSLSVCFQRAGGMEPTGLHTAVGDVLDVVRLLRYALTRKDSDEAQK